MSNFMFLLLRHRKLNRSLPSTRNVMMTSRSVTRLNSIHFRNTFTPSFYGNIRFLSSNIPYMSSQDIFGSMKEVEKNSLDDIKFEELYKARDHKSIYDVRDGTILNLNEYDIQKYIPEGLAGETDKAFDMHEEPSWMIRDSTKLVCRLIDHFHKPKNNIDMKPSIYPKVKLNGLTDKPEWNNAHVRVQMFGKDVLDNPIQYNIKGVPISKHKKTIINDDNEDVIICGGKGSKVEEYYDRIKSASVGREIPRQIMLLGPKGVGKSTILNQAVLHARQNGWLVLFIPNGWAHVHDGNYVDPIYDKDHLPQTKVAEEQYIIDEIQEGDTDTELHVSEEDLMMDEDEFEAAVGTNTTAKEEKKSETIENIKPSNELISSNKKAIADNEYGNGGYTEEEWQLIEERLLKIINNEEIEEEDDHEIFSIPKMKKGIEKYLDRGGKIVMFDNVQMSSEALRGFYRSHSDMLEKLPIQKPEIFDKYEEIHRKFKDAYYALVNASGGKGRSNFIELRRTMYGGDGIADEINEEDVKDKDILEQFDFDTMKTESLKDLVLFGLIHRSVAGQIFVDLVEELKLLEPKPDNDVPPVLIVVDQYNCFDSLSSFAHLMKDIQGTEICVPKALYNIEASNKAKTMNNEWKNGLFLCAYSHYHSEGRQITYENKKNSIPLAITIPHYSQQEYLSIFSYYKYRNLLSVANLNLNDILAYRSYCGSNPWYFQQNLFHYFLPLDFKRSDIDFTTMDTKDIDNALASKALDKRNFHEYFSYDNVEFPEYTNTTQDDEEIDAIEGDINDDHDDDDDKNRRMKKKKRNVRKK